MVLRAKSKGGNIYSRKPMKIQQKKKGKNVLFKPKPLSSPPLPPQRSGCSTPEGCCQEHRVPSPPSSQMGGFLPGEVGLQHFPFCLQLPVSEQVWLGSWGSFPFTKPHFYTRGSVLGVAC